MQATNTFLNSNKKRYKQTNLFDLFNQNKRQKYNEKRLEKSMSNHTTIQDDPASLHTSEASTSCSIKNLPLEENAQENELSNNSQNSEDLFPDLDEAPIKAKFNGSSKEKEHPVRVKIRPSNHHIVLFKVTGEWKEDVSYDPHPSSYKDYWDSDHVRMPCSPHNLFPVKDKLESRWDLIKEALLAPFTSSYDIEEAILSYNTQQSNQWDFSGLHKYFKEVPPKESTFLMEHVVPGMAQLALSLPSLCTQAVPLLRQHKDLALSLTQSQVACLLANAFFCTFPRRISVNRRKKKEPHEYANYPDINFNRLYIGRSQRPEQLRKRLMKLKALFHYFTRVLKKKPDGTITIHRQCLDHFPDWSVCSAHLTPFTPRDDGLIETDGKGMLQVDFANKLVGGGVLGLGCVQEEIRFLICPELLVTRLVTEKLAKNEALIIKGCEQYSSYTGYGDTFTWDGDFQDNTPRDESGRLCTEIVAMDALSFLKEETQYCLENITRELNKAYTGFFEPKQTSLAPVATGNWGCGAFRGDPYLKSLLQWMAASAVGRPVMYFTFHSTQLKEELTVLTDFLREKGLSVGDLWDILEDFSRVRASDPKRKLFPFIFKTFHVKEESDDSTDIEKNSFSPQPPTPHI